MVAWIRELDRLLRGDVTRPEALHPGKLELNAAGLAVLDVLLGAVYGLCMGSYSLLKEVPPELQEASQPHMQLLATTIKVPALFFLTLLVTFPSLYVFNALVGSRLSLTSVMQLLVASLAVNLAVLSSLGPIALFFSVSTKSYPFILLLNVVMFTVAGVLGLAFLLQTLHRLTEGATWRGTRRSGEAARASGQDSTSESIAADKNMDANNREDPSALDMPSGQALGRHTRLVFGCWVVVFSLVGAQMGWVLRPFIGNPNLPFSWFRERKSNFFEAVMNSISALFNGG